MTADEFWEHVHATGRDGSWAHAEALVARLAKLPEEEILDFHHCWLQMDAEASSWALWGAAYLIRSGSYDDRFRDFRSWLILQGRTVFLDALASPDSLADHLRDCQCTCECDPGFNAWFEATGTPPDHAGHRVQAAAYEARYPWGREASGDLGEEFDYDNAQEMQQRYPRLWARFG
jgi:hypothetical protein